MPIIGALLGAQLVAAVAPPDPLGIAGWTAVGSVIAAWGVQTIVNPLGGSPLIAAGPAVTGTGALIPGPSPLLGLGLAAAALSADAAGLAKWQDVASALASWMTSGGVNPSTLVAYTSPVPPTGPVAGVATLQFPSTADLASAAGVSDEAGIAKWTAVALAVKAHFEALALVTPAMTNPAIGGPLVGTGTVS